MDDSKRLITSLLMNAIVPKYFLPDYFDFIFDIYKVNFDYDLVDADEEFRFIFNGLYNALVKTEESDELNLSVTKKSYHLIQSTKKFIISEKSHKFENAIRFSEEVINLIDHNYWNKSKGGAKDSFFSDGYQEWVKKHQKETTGTKPGPTSTNVFTSRWEPFVYLDRTSKKFILCPPNHRIKDDIDYSKLIIRVYNGGEIIYQKKKPEIEKFVIGGYVVKSEKIEIKNPLGKLKYVVLEGDNVIYDSNEKLYRKVFVFNPETGLEIKNNTEYSGDAIFCYQFSLSALDDFYKTEDYRLGIKNVNIGDVLYFDGEPFSFSKMSKPGICGDKINNLYIETGLEKMPVYSNIDYLMFETKSEIADISVKVNNVRYKLKNLDFRIKKKELWNQYIVFLPINKSDIYRVSAVKNSTGEIIKDTDFSFFLDKGYECESTKINSLNYKVWIDSDFFESDFNVDICLSDFEELTVPFVFDEKEYTYLIPMDFDLYRIDEGSWRIHESSMWIDDIKSDSVAEVYGCGFDDIQVIGYKDEKATLLEPINCNHKNNISSFKIGHILSYKNSYSKILLNWRNSNNENKGIWLDFECEVDKRNTVIDYNPYERKLMIIPVFYGAGPIDVEISCNDTNDAIKLHDVKTNEKYFVENLAENRLYKVAFTYTRKNLLIGSKKTLYDKDCLFISYNNLEGLRFNVKNVEYDEQVLDYSINARGEYITEKLSDKPIKTNIVIRKKISDNCYLADAYRNLDAGDIFFNNLKTLQVNVIGEIRNGLMDAVITCNGSLLSYDTRHKTFKDDVNIGESKISSYELVAEVKNG